MALDADDEVLLATARYAMAVSLRAADAIGEVSAVQLRALTVLALREGAKLVDLAEELNVTVSTASRLVDRLVAAGLVDRRRSQEVRREIRLTLTREGRATLERFDGLRLERFRGGLATMPADERAAVLSALAALVRSAEEFSRQQPGAADGAPAGA